MNSLRPLTSVTAVFLSLATGCALGPSVLPTPTPEEIPALEARLQSAPDDIESGMRLAAAYRVVERQGDARTLLAALTELDPENLGLMVMTGLLAEDVGEFAEARAAYQAALAGDPGQALGVQIEQRLAIVRRQEFRADVAAALDREEQLAQTPPDPAAIGVFPFVYEGEDPTWEPLALALPELLATDLAVTGRLRIVERLRIQALVEEIALTAGGRVDPATAARGGRLLGSGHLVQGRFSMGAGEQISVDAAVVEVLGPDAEQVDPVVAQDVLERLFELEKQLAFDIHAELGIQLTPAEREAISERQTESVEALLAFGRGLQAMNVGNFQLAEQNFQQAEQLDPSFTLASNELAEAQVVVQATTPPAPTGQPGVEPTPQPVDPEPQPQPGDPPPGPAPLPPAPIELPSLTQQLAQQRASVQQLQPPATTAPSQILQTLGQGSDRSVIAEVTGTDRVGQVTLLQLILRPPPGNEQ